MDINTKLLCKKQMADDINEHGIDFIIGNETNNKSICSFNQIRKRRK